MLRFARCLVALTALAVGACTAKPTTTTVAIAAPPPSPAAPAPAPLPGDPAKGGPEGDEPSADEEETDEVPLEQDPRADAPSRGWLGVELEPAGATEPGVRVVRVVPRSPAEKEGLLPGDLILKVDDQAVSSPSDVVGIVSTRGAGADVGLVMKRGTVDRLGRIKLAVYPGSDAIFRMSFVDKPAPPFESLATAKGSVAPTLLAQRGQVVIVEFWAPWCVACRALIPHMNQWHAQYAARGVRVMGITGESVPRALSAANQLGMDYSVLSDATGKTQSAYQARAIPAVFVIDRRGTIRDVMVGYDAPRLAKLDTLVERLVAEP